MSRNSSAILVIGSLLGGLILGFSLGRGTSPVSAQVGGATVGQAAPASNRTDRGPVSLDVTSRDNEVYDNLARAYEQFAQVDRMFEMVTKAVSPTVVHIVAQKSSQTDESARVRKFEETGSGVIVRADKSDGLYVLTNHHVINGGKAEKIRILLHDGRTLTPEKVWSDAMADVGVLKLPKTDLPAARLGNSDMVEVGSWVLAMGSPFGLMHSVSQGIISARGRHMDELQGVENQDFFQTDAAINPGNSGGPLINMKGEVIGINNSIASNGGGNEGVGFSIPINLARWIMNELIDHGHVVRGALGVDLQPDYGADEALRLGLDRPKGAWIGKVHPGSPAAKAGIRDGDVILKFGGIEVHDLNHLINLVSMTPVGGPAELTVWRDRREIQLGIIVGDRERPVAKTAVASANPVRNGPSDLLNGAGENGSIPSVLTVLGLDLVTLNKQMAVRSRLPETMRGAMILEIDRESPLATFCQANDIISRINDQSVRSAEEVVRLVKERSEHDPLILTFDRRGREGIERYSVRVP
jgi:serine protease Do